MFNGPVRYYNFPLGSDCALPRMGNTEGSDKDVDELSEWYDKVSGGLMIKAFCLEKHSVESKSLEELIQSRTQRKYSSKNWCVKERRGLYSLSTFPTLE
jgi:hypothetical protein